MPVATKAFAALSATTPLVPFQFERRDVRAHDVQIDILFCGVCHSDLHQARDEWGGSLYPMVPGHEIVGRVTRVGAAVTRFKPGDLAGVGVLVDSCRTCSHCQAGLEQYCMEGMTGTYNGYERDGKTLAQGGYSTTIVTDERYVVRISPNLPLAATAPLLCAGITTYSPLRHVRVGPGTRVAVVGLGGLGHMGVKFAAAFGAHVALVSTTKSKEADAKRLGAHEFIHSADSAQMKKFRGYFHVVLNTVSAPHDYDPYLQLLGLNGTLVVVGLPSENPSVSPFSLLANRRSMLGSMVGGIAETQEMLDFCAERDIVSDVEVIPVQAVNDAYVRMLRGDVRYRFVIDLASLR